MDGGLFSEPQKEKRRRIKDRRQECSPAGGFSKPYCFRWCDGKGIATFGQDQLWSSPGYKMNDDFEALLHFDKKRISQKRFRALRLIGKVPPADQGPGCYWQRLSVSRTFAILSAAVCCLKWPKTVRTVLPICTSVTQSGRRVGCRFACWGIGHRHSFMKNDPTEVETFCEAHMAMSTAI